MTKKFCKVCNEYKAPIHGTWVTLHGKPVGNVCLACNAKRHYAYNKLRQATASGKAKHIELSLKWLKDNPGKASSHCRRYQTKLVNRLPAWLTVDDMFLIDEAYELAVLRTRLTGIRWSVDHIIPLNGKHVSGLHVPENLQVITLRGNRQKGNKYD